MVVGRLHQLFKCSIVKLELSGIGLVYGVHCSKTSIATQSFMLLANQSSSDCSKITNSILDI